MLFDDAIQRVYAKVDEMIEKRLAAHVAEYHEPGRIQEAQISPKRVWHATPALDAEAVRRIASEELARQIASAPAAMPTKLVSGVE